MPNQQRGCRPNSLYLLVFFCIFLPRLSGATEIGYREGFFLRTDDKDYQFKFNLVAQPQHRYEWREAAVDANSFGTAQLKTIFQGNAFAPQYKYYLELEYSSAAGKLNVEDAYLNLGFPDYFILTVGQFKIPTNREDLLSGIGNQLVGVSLMYEHFAVLQDLGLQFSGRIVDPVTYALFVTNGDGRNQPNRNKEMLTGGRLEVTPWGEISPYQGDQENSENPNLGFGIGAAYDFGSAAETEDFDLFRKQGVSVREDRLTRIEADGTLAWRGTSLLAQWQGVYNSQYRSFDHGYLAQGGYFILPKKLEVAGRFSAVVPDFPFPALALTGITAESLDSFGGGIPVYEAGGGLNYFFKGHAMKIQTDYSMILNSGGVRNLNDQMIRTQLTLMF